MALISCPECDAQVSDAAQSCPSCGHPISLVVEQPSDKPDSKQQLFTAGKANFVLEEIAAISSLKTRNWLLILIFLPFVAGCIYTWLSQHWLVAAVTTVIGLVVLGSIYVDEGKVASTGNVTLITEDMGKVTDRYHQAIGEQNLVRYSGSTTFVDMQFSINPNRVAEFTRVQDHGWLMFLGVAVVLAGAAAYLAMPLVYLPAIGVGLLGLLSRKASLEISGVGGAKLQLYTKAGDINQVLQQLTAAIEQR